MLQSAIKTANPNPKNVVPQINVNQSDPPPTPRSKGRGIVLDKVQPSDFLHLNLIFACEQCMHFDGRDRSCTFGYISETHQRETQLKLYEMSGRMAFCRYQEID